MLSAAIGGAVIHPLVVDLDDETLRAQLLRLARRSLDLPDQAQTPPDQAQTPPDQAQTPPDQAQTPPA